MMRTAILIFLVFICVMFAGCNSKKNNSNTEDITITHKQELDDLFGDWKVVGTAIVPTNMQFSSYEYMEWEIEYKDSYGTIVRSKMTNEFYDFENVLKNAWEDVMQAQVTKLFNENDLNLTNGSRLAKTRNERIIFNTEDIDFNSPEYYPKNTNLDSLKNTNSYLRLRKSG